VLRLFLDQGECLEDDAFAEACFGNQNEVTFVEQQMSRTEVSGTQAIATVMTRLGAMKMVYSSKLH
jgi:hypothetical protein